MTEQRRHAPTRVAIVNRGEAAMRFLNAAGEYRVERDVPLETVALYTDADASSWFVREADHAVHLGPTMTTDAATGARKHTYLDLDVLESALRRSGADAVWPGWGFVAENPDFVRMCERIGVRFIGPSAAAMDLLGSKIAAKRVAESVAVPVVPWSGGPVDTADEAVEHARRIGYPVVVKAAAGGGGRGIRVVTEEADLHAAFASARAEAASAFGNPTLFLEAQIVGGRHLEVQVAADGVGNVWALGLRDCSVQRRRQKVLEESAPVDLSAALQKTILDAARRLCRAVEYTNVGTVEFLARPDTGDFYFLEVNTRLQVEHTVTEAVTGVDLVKLQLDIACGATLTGEPPAPRGHAVEVRLNAEDPRRGFAPAPGRIVELRIPQGSSVRTDAGVVVGDTIAAEFDSMIAKVIAWGGNRREALARLRRSLARSTAVVEGGTTNRRFLMALLDNPEIRGGHVDTTWLDRALAAGVLLDSPDAPVAVLIAGIEAYRRDRADALEQFVGKAAHGRIDEIDDATPSIDLEYEGDRRSLHVVSRATEDFTIAVDAQAADGVRLDVRYEVLGEFERRLSIGEREWPATVVANGPIVTVEVGHSVYRVVRGYGGLVRAESQCVVAKMVASVDQVVAPGDVLFISEAMKMESPVLAPFAGRVTEIIADSGTMVGAGDPVLRVEAIDDARGDDSARLSFTEFASGRAQASTADHDALAQVVLGRDLDDAVDVAAAARTVSFDNGLRVLRIAAHRLALFANRPDLLLFAVRSPDRIDDVAPADFVARLRAVLGHYGITEIAHSTSLTDTLYDIWRAESRLDRIAQISAVILERWLSIDHDASRSPALVEVLDDLIAATEVTHPAVADLGRAVRHRLVEHPAAATLRAADEALAEKLLVSPADRMQVMSELLHLPAPLDRHLAAATAAAGDRGAVALEALVRRLHRHRQLTAFAVLPEADDVVGVRTTRTDGAETVAVIAVSGSSSRLRDMLATAARALEATGPTDVEIVLRDADLDTEALTAAVSEGFIAPDGLSVTVTWWPTGCGVDDDEAPRRHRTFVGVDGVMAAADRSAGLHPATADRLELWRLDDFDVTALDAPDGIHLLRAVAVDNDHDERLIALLEVFALDGDSTAGPYAHLRSQLSQAAVAIRRARAALRDPSTSLSNRIVIYAAPTWTVTDAELQTVIAQVLPLTRGLGLEKVIVSVRTRDRATREPVEEIIHITTPPTTGVMIGRTKPSPSRMRPMSEYRRRVVAMQRRGLVYPYEIVELLVGTGATHTELPTGEFIEYDYVADRFGPVDRPRGQNTARVVTGVVDSLPDGAAVPIRRVLILNEPSRDLASLGEPECLRIIAAIDLAAESGVPVEWYAVSSGARIAMDSGTENLDWTAAVLRRIIEFTQAGGEINVVVVGVNVGAQSYFDAESTMLMHTSGVLIMVGRSAMVLTGKQALEFSGGVAAEDNAGIGGYQRIAGPNGQAQFWVPDVESACALLFRHYESSLPFGAHRPTADPVDRDITSCPHRDDGTGSSFATVGDVFSPVQNPDRKRPFDIRSVLDAVRDHDAPPLERWTGWRDAENVVAWDTRLGGYAVSLVGIESRNLRRRLPRPVDGPDSWTAGTLFPQSSKKLARIINGASGRRPLVILANLSGFDGSPESMRTLQLEYGAEIGRAIVNFRGPIVFTVISRYHGGAYVVFSKSLNPSMEVAAIEGSRASVIGGAPAAAVVFTREVRARVRAHAAVTELERDLADAAVDERPVLQHRLHQLTTRLTTEVQTAVAREFDDVHTVERAKRVGSIDHIVRPGDLRPYLIGAVSRGLQKTSNQSSEGTRCE